MALLSAKTSLPVRLSCSAHGLLPNPFAPPSMLIDFDLIRKDIGKAKLLKPDLVLVHYHFGQEYQREPNQYQQEVVAKTIEMGADIIIGGHPHVLQPVKFIKSSQSVFDSVFE